MPFESYLNKKVLITGHTGFKGSWLAAWLQELGAQVVGMALDPNTTPNHFDLLNLDMDSRMLDIRNAEQVSKAILQIKPDIVFHLAAQPLVRESYVDPLGTLDTNVMGTANILNSCRNVDTVKAIVIVTSDKCYENKEWVWGYRETEPMGGHDPYSASKGCAELVTSCFRRSFFNLADYGKTHTTLIATARAGNVIGGGDWAEDRLIPDMVRAVDKGIPVIIRNPHATRPWQHVLESLGGYLCLGERLWHGDKSVADAWNFGPTSEGIDTVLHVLQTMQGYWPTVQYEINSDPLQFHEANWLKLDCSKAAAVLKWKNRLNTSQAVQKTVNWYRNYYEAHKISTREDIRDYMKLIEKVG